MYTISILHGQKAALSDVSHRGSISSIVNCGEQSFSEAGVRAALCPPKGIGQRRQALEQSVHTGESTRKVVLLSYVHST